MHERPLYFVAVLSSNAVLVGYRTELIQTFPHVRKSSTLGGFTTTYIF